VSRKGKSGVTAVAVPIAVALCDDLQTIYHPSATTLQHLQRLAIETQCMMIELYIVIIIITEGSGVV